MLWLLFLISIFCNGIILTGKFLGSTKNHLLTLANSFVAGSLISVSFIYILSSYIFKSLAFSLTVYFLLSVFLFFLNYKYFEFPKTEFKKKEILFICILFFSFWLFLKSFGYNSSSGQFLIASNLYQDFGAHIPFIRSFSLGSNFPAEVPFFSSSNLIYHFMFDFFAGIFEFLGLRIDIALNLISSISFSFLITMIFYLSSYIFKSSKVGLISVLLFVFNSSLSFLSFFSNYHLEANFITALWRNSFYLGNGPLGSSTVSVFWNLNTYLNQRHLIFGVLFGVWIIYYLLVKTREELEKKQFIFLGMLLGLLPFWHISIFVGLYVILFSLFIVFPNFRKQIIILFLTSLILALPQILLIKLNSKALISFAPGFLVFDKLSANNLLIFWFWNLGISILTIPLGFLLSNNTQRKIFLCLLPILVMVNIFQFGNYMFDNHKFINLWIIFANFYSAFVIVLLWNKNTLFKTFSAVILFFLVLSGVINLMVVKNDVFAKIEDYPNNKLMTWTLYNIPSNETVLTNGEIYDPLSLIGKKIFLGLPRYIYLYGGDPAYRQTAKGEILTGNNINKIKNIAKNYKIKYIVIYKNNFAKNETDANLILYRKYLKIDYEDNNGVVFEI